MTAKIFAVIGVVAAVIVVILFFTTLMPFWNEVVQTTNASMSSHNLTDYPGSQGVVVSSPLWLYFVPVVAGGIAVVAILISKKGRGE